LNTLNRGTYQGFTGGLYADGRNAPHGPHAEALRKRTGAVQPLNAEGKPDPAGKIVVVGIGASVCKQVFDALAELGPTAEGKRPEVVFINCARGGHDVNKISDPERRYWEFAKAAVERAGYSAAQVQVAWYQSDDLRDVRTDFPGRPQRLQEAIARNMRELKQHFPSTQLCYHSARHTTAFAPDTSAKEKHGEPRPYHVGWAVKWLLEAQAAGQADLRFEGDHPVAPLVTWATYFWTEADQARPDGYRWTRDEVVKDGIHLSGSGKARVANELLAFWRTDPFARTWFTGRPASTADTASNSPAPPATGTSKPQFQAAQRLQPGGPALLINGKSKFAKLERLLETRDGVRLVAWNLDGRQVLEIEDVFNRRTDLNALLGPGQFRLHFLDRTGQRLKMTLDVPEVVRLK
jgi:hypothetical protein